MEPFRFLFIADCQLGCYATFSGLSDEQVERFARRDMKVRSFPPAEGWAWDAARYTDVVAVANELRPDFVVLGGDMIDDVGVPGQLDAVLAISAGLDDSIPLHWVPGNHDIAVDAVNPTEETIDFYRSAFCPDYYAFDREGASFIVVNTVLLDRPDRVAEEAEAHLGFLEQALRDASARPGPTIVFGHHPLFITEPDEADSYWTVSRDRRRPVLDLLAEHHVAAVFSGHRHRNAHASHDGIELVTSSAVGFPLGDDPSGYRVVDVGGDKLAHRYYGLARQGWD